MAQYKATALAEAGIEAAESSISARCVSQALMQMASELEQILEDGTVTASEIRRQRRMILRLAKEAREAEDAADLGASASNRIGVAEHNIWQAVKLGGDVRAALYQSSDRGDHVAERAAGVSVLSDSRGKDKAATPSSPDAA